MIDEDALAKAIERLKEETAVDAVWLFGSEATGRASEGSDVDLAVLFSSPADPSRLMQLQSLMERHLRHPVDLVDLRRASPLLGMQVVRQGKLLLDRRPSSRAAFVASLPSRRYDLLRVRRESERRLLERTRSGRT